MEKIIRLLLVTVAIAVVVACAPRAEDKESSLTAPASEEESIAAVSEEAVEEEAGSKPEEQTEAVKVSTMEGRPEKGIYTTDVVDDNGELTGETTKFKLQIPRGWTSDGKLLFDEAGEVGGEIGNARVIVNQDDAFDGLRKEQAEITTDTLEYTLQYKNTYLAVTPAGKAADSKEYAGEYRYDYYIQYWNYIYKITFYSNQAFEWDNENSNTQKYFEMIFWSFQPTDEPSDNTDHYGVIFKNTIGKDMTEMFIVPAGVTDWGERINQDYIYNTEGLENPEQLGGFYLPQGIDGVLYDIRLVDEDGKEYIFSDVDLSGVYVLEFALDDLGEPITKINQ